MDEYISGASDSEMTAVDSTLPVPRGSLYLLSHLFIQSFCSFLLEFQCQTLWPYLSKQR